MRRTAFSLLALAAIVPLAAVPSLQRPSGDPNQILDRAIDDFLAGRVEESVAGFDRVVALVPGAEPRLWQRGIALYYTGRYDACRRQFELHRTVNPNDVENPVWHFLCVSKAESPERARDALLPVGSDQRQPMREIYLMFRGDLSPADVLAAGTTSASARFYSELYVGLYYDGMGEPDEAKRHLREAADSRYEAVGGYMHRVATLHPLLDDSPG
jgi:lipoprotein NlpI